MTLSNKTADLCLGDTKDSYCLVAEGARNKLSSDNFTIWDEKISLSNISKYPETSKSIKLHSSKQCKRLLSKMEFIS